MWNSWFRSRTTLLSLVLLITLACGHKQSATPAPDHPRLIPGVQLQDVTFYSAALKREMPYRVILPEKIAPGQKLRVVYLLHGGGSDFRAWSNYSDISSYAAWGFLLVMPEGNSSYFMNAADRADDKYEDYIVHDLISDVEERFPVTSDRRHRAIAGVSMGGYGAIVLSFRHPDLFEFAAGLSPALDVPSRPFSIKRIGQWHDHRSIFGSWNGVVQKSEDPYLLAKSVDPGQSPYFFLTCGDREGLFPANQRFSQLLRTRKFSYEFHDVRNAGHDWGQWNSQVPAMMQALAAHLTQ